MLKRSLPVALVTLAACAGAAVALRSQTASMTADMRGKGVTSELEKLRATCDQLTEENRQLAGHIAKLRTEHESVRDVHKRRLDSLSGDVLKNKAGAEAGLAALKKHFEDQNLRIEWKRGDIGVTPGTHNDQEIDFKKPVVEAIAVLTRFHFQYPRNDDHNVRQVVASVEVVGINGTKVKVRCHAWMDDNSGNRSDRHGMTYTVFARIKSN